MCVSNFCEVEQCCQLFWILFLFFLLVSRSTEVICHPVALSDTWKQLCEETNRELESSKKCSGRFLGTFFSYFLESPNHSVLWVGSGPVGPSCCALVYPCFMLSLLCYNTLPSTHLNLCYILCKIEFTGLVLLLFWLTTDYLLFWIYCRFLDVSLLVE